MKYQSTHSQTSNNVSKKKKSFGINHIGKTPLHVRALRADV